MLKAAASFVLMFVVAAVVSAQGVVLDLPHMTQYLDGVQTTEDLRTRTDIAQIAVKDPTSVYYFTTDAKFENWAQSISGGAAAISRLRALNNIYNYVQTHGYADLADDATLPADLSQYMESQLPGSTGLHTETALFCTYFDYVNFGGANKFCPGVPWWTLGNFRNRAESAYGSGAGLITFCSHRWFGGRKMFLFMVGYFSVKDFGAMNNDIESHF